MPRQYQVYLGKPEYQKGGRDHDQEVVLEPRIARNRFGLTLVL
jgi:hypothetical protein